MKPPIVVLNIDEAPRGELRHKRGTTIQLVNETIGAKNADVHLNVLDPGGSLGDYHYHERAENIYVILSGRARMVVEGQEYFAGEGQVIFIPPGVKHATANAGDTPLRLIEIYAPGGADFHVVE